MNTDTPSGKETIRIEARSAFERGYLGPGASHFFEDNAVELMVRVLPAMVAMEKDVRSISIQKYIDFCSIDNLRKVAVDKRLPEPILKDVYEWLDTLGIPLEGPVPDDVAMLHKQCRFSWVVREAEDNMNSERECRYELRPDIEDRFNQVVSRVYYPNDIPQRG